MTGRPALALTAALAALFAVLALLTGCTPEDRPADDGRPPLQRCLEDKDGIGC